MGWISLGAAINLLRYLECHCQEEKKKQHHRPPAQSPALQSRGTCKQREYEVLHDLIIPFPSLKTPRQQRLCSHFGSSLHWGPEDRATLYAEALFSPLARLI